MSKATSATGSFAKLVYLNPIHSFTFGHHYLSYTIPIVNRVGLFR
jgi:hypothetical protein